MNERQILSFIKHFTIHGPDVIDCFSNGNCYWFARILAQRFQGEIFYNISENHFMCNINGYLYDIDGRLKTQTKPLNKSNWDLDDMKGWIPWHVYRWIDASHANRIQRDCIRLDT